MRARTGGLAAGVLLTATACSGSSPARPAEPSSPVAAGGRPAATASSAPSMPSASPATPGTPTPAGSASPHPTATSARTQPPLSTPATSSGPLRPASLPAPAALLGAGWLPYVDPGSREDGYLGNGTPWLSREPGEVAATVLPLGCRRRSTLPTPRYALETDGMDGAGHRAVVIRARFASAAAATAFVDRTAADARACSRQPAETGPAGSSAPVSTVQTVGGVVVSDRVDVYADSAAGARWSEFKLAGGLDVLLLAVDQRLDGPHSWRASAVAAALRSAMTSAS